MKWLLALTVSALLVLSGYGQYGNNEKNVGPHDIPRLLSRFNEPLSGSQRAAALLDISYAYLYKKGALPTDLDSGRLYTRQLGDLAMRLNSNFYQQEVLILHALFSMKQKDFAGSEKMLPAMDDTTRLKTLQSMADYCNIIAPNETDGLYYIGLSTRYSEAALKLAIKTKVYIERTALALESSAIYYRVRHQVSLAEKYFLMTLQCTEVTGFPSAVRVYCNLSIVFTIEGNFFKAMEYGKRAEKALTAQSSDYDVVAVCNALGSLSAVQERPERVLHYYDRLMKDPRRYMKFYPYYGFVATYCANLQKLNRINEVLPLMQKLQRLAPPELNPDRYYACLALGRCYRELGQFDQAEKHFLDGIQYAEASRIATGAIRYHLGILYFQYNQFEKALATFKLAEKTMSTENNPLIAMNYSYLAKASSALGRYEEGYRYLLKSKDLSDSSFTVGRARLTDELETQYEVQKKEADLRLKEQNIQTLNHAAAVMRQDALLKDAALKEADLVRQRNEIALQLRAKDVEGLKKDRAMRDNIIQQAEVRKRVTLLIIGLMAVIVALLCWLFWSKMKSNKMITRQNGQLQQLVKDKSWLLKEMHHRVKNNLHTIVSLLEYQSSYLQDDALQAIQHSQSRIFAMSLIHQKLYQTDDMRTIDMAEYVPELVRYLDESFNIGRSVRIFQDIDHTAFVVDEAIALGLIINEAVTNAMKYAFCSDRPGEICITFTAAGEDEFELVIADNGRGLPADFDFRNTSSLGFQLIRGLSEQLEASLAIVNENGLKITISGISGLRIDELRGMENELRAQAGIGA